LKDKIWVICFEKSDSDIVAKQLISKAHSLALKSNQDVCAICVGNYSEQHLTRLYNYGADEVVWLNVIDYDYKSIAIDLFNLSKLSGNTIRLIIFSACEMGKCVSAVLSIKMEAGLTADCIDIFYDKHAGGDYIFLRTAMSSTMMAEIKCKNSSISICTYKGNIIYPCGQKSKSNITIQKYTDLSKKEIQRNVLKCTSIEEIVESTDLANSKIIFGIGRGVKSINDVQHIKMIAQKYKACVVGSRGAIELNYLEYSLQVGQSGCSIAPDLYIAIGLSGASQHLIGIKNSKCIVAINIDEYAPICSIANYCIIDDYKKILNELQ